MNYARNWRILNFRAGCGLSVLALLLPGFETAAVAAAPQYSWAKPGVGYEQFRADAFDCGIRGLATDISQTEPVTALRKATREMESYDSTLGTTSTPDQSIANAQNVDSIRASARPSYQVKRIKEIMFVTVRACMVELGYVSYTLTEQQRAKYDSISDRNEQRHYLHSLASDPAVAEAQKRSAGN
ncbi:MAG: hypothetical protein ABJA20_10860 [Novosphingobium sp.]